VFGGKGEKRLILRWGGMGSAGTNLDVTVLNTRKEIMLLGLDFHLFSSFIFSMTVFWGEIEAHCSGRHMPRGGLSSAAQWDD
jgi:hypothetical protein